MPGTAGSASSERDGGGGFRADIQALRAVAVVAVVAFHIWPTGPTGGFVGVDVFFVISGYLITAHLWREARTTGRVGLPGFWARRARRLLPASLVTLVVTVLAVYVFVPETLWERFAGDAGFAAFYVVNWRLAADAVDYFAAEQAVSPVQHFWSLSVEEQFYLVWPVLVLVSALVAPRSARVLRIVLGSVGAASLVFSLVASAASPATAYFSTPVRAWEFAAGALLALAPSWRAPGGARVLVGVGGLVAIGAAVALFDESMDFPGWWALLPVLGAVAVIVAGDPGGVYGRVMRWRPIQWLGDASYSIYLWHWPLIVLAPYVLDRAPDWGDRLVVIVLTLVLAWLSYRYVETPVRRWRGLGARPPRVTLAATAGGMALVALLAIGGSLWVGGLRQVEREQETAVSQDPQSCYAAAAMDPELDCDPTALDGVLVPSPLTAPDDAVSSCMVPNEDDEVRVCDFGADPGRAEATVALVGDSHAAHFLPTLLVLAEERNWSVQTYLKGSCAFSEAVRSSSYWRACERWKAGVRERLAAADEVSIVVTSGSSKNEFRPAEGESAEETAVRGYVDAWRALPAQVESVVVIRDVPRPREDVLECLQRLGSVEKRLEPGACALPRDDALLFDPAEEAARESRDPRVGLVDLSDLFCDDALCHAVVGHATAYRDGHHITASMARSLAPYLAARWPAG